MAVVLLFGSGGRESAIAWKLAQSPLVQEIIVAPGNAGMIHIAKTSTIPVQLHPPSMLELANSVQPDLIIVGGEQPLVEGVVDLLEQHGHMVLGPKRYEAQLEGSKIFAKNTLLELSIPTAQHQFAQTHQAACDIISNWTQGDMVIKADGLAGGKGVHITADKDNAREILDAWMLRGTPIKAQRVLIEERLYGREVSAFALISNGHFLPLGYAHDYKRSEDGDLGAQTGGMGAHTTTEYPNSAEEQQIHDIFAKIAKKFPHYTGILYAGLIIKKSTNAQTNSLVSVLEFNVRFGDPEAQALLPTLCTDLYEIFYATATHTLHQHTHIQQKQACVHVVLCSKGYPTTDLLLHQDISLPPHLPDHCSVFFAGVSADSSHRLQNNAGRVLGVSCVGQNLEEARTRSYDIVQQIHFTGMKFRTDIGTHKQENL